MTKRFDLEARLGELGARYRALGKAGKGELLSELCGMTGYHRKYLIFLLSEAGLRKAPARRGRGAHYGSAEIRLLFELWKRTGSHSTERFKSKLPLLLPYASAHIRGWTPEASAVGLSISARQLSRRFARLKASSRRQSNSATRRARMLRHQVEVSTSRPLDAAPGLVECDLVAHGGDSVSGSFIWTVNATDVASGWVAAAPVLGSSALQVLPALRQLFERMPFRVKELHTDNGSEFINGHLVRECKQRKIRMTRGRPNRKNDNARIEQKNWTHVRQVVGYARFDSEAELRQLNRVYAIVETLANLFEPNSRLVAKSRDGAKLRRQYDRPLTPLDRLVAWHRRRRRPLTEEIEDWLRIRAETDPIELYDRLRQEVARLRQLKRKAVA